MQGKGIVWVLVGIAAIPCVRAADPTDAELDRRFSQTVRPFLTSYCIGCHSGASAAAQLDLRSYTSVAAVTADYPHWNLVMEKLAANEMPPKTMKQMHGQLEPKLIDVSATKNLPAPGGTESFSTE